MGCSSFFIFSIPVRRDIERANGDIAVIVSEELDQKLERRFGLVAAARLPVVTEMGHDDARTQKGCHRNEQ